MRLSPTLTWYFGKHVLFSILAVLALLIGLILIGDTIELLRRAGGKPDATVGIVVQMATSRIPFMTEKVLPFAVLFGSMFSFWKLTGNQELVVTRAAGVSAWQFLLPPILCALILGSIQVAALNPVAAIRNARSALFAEQCQRDEFVFKRALVAPGHTGWASGHLCTRGAQPAG